MNDTLKRFAVRASCRQSQEAGQHADKGRCAQVTCVGKIQHSIAAAIKSGVQLPAEHGFTDTGLSGQKQIAVLIVAKGVFKVFKCTYKVGEGKVGGWIHG